MQDDIPVRSQMGQHRRSNIDYLDQHFHQHRIRHTRQSRRSNRCPNLNLESDNYRPVERRWSIVLGRESRCARLVLVSADHSGRILPKIGVTDHTKHCLRILVMVFQNHPSTMVCYRIHSRQHPKVPRSCC